MSFIALADCNNFFVSCERLFNPKLHKKAVVVLSSNDGCIISRSQEAKALGIPMGAPFFQWADFMKKQQVVCLSSNFALYGDLSERVMSSLAELNPEIEIYSVDEAFLSLISETPLEDCRKIKEKVFQWTGIPVSIGIARTKTLAKVANHHAKKRSGLFGLLSLREEENILRDLDVEEVWGIGRRLSEALKRRGIQTALALKNQDDLWIRKHFSVVMLRTVEELRGIPCLSLEEVRAPKQSIMTSRSFGRQVFDKAEIEEAVALYAATGAEDLRAQDSFASFVSVFITTKHYEDNYYSNWANCVFPQPSNYTPTLIHYAKEALNAIFRPGFPYRKAGVLYGGLVSPVNFQPDLFATLPPEEEKAQNDLMALMDLANEEFGYPILQFAAEGIKKPWQTKKRLRSPRFTTRWEDLLTIRI